MKLRPVTKLDKRNRSTLKKFDDDVMSANCDNIAFFRFTANFQPSGSWIPSVWSIKLAFSLIVTFFLHNLKTELKNL